MIDWTRVADLRSEIGDESFAEVIDLFLEETDEVTLRLSQANPSPAIGRDLHFLKGSALNLGFCDLAQLCADGERLAAANDGLGIDLGRILRCYHASKISFQDGRAQVSAA
jgi:HPt (histidine-containing phosphotransfer) domain-containing protein